MTATERLRAMLDERGIEYSADENGVSWHSTYHQNDFAYDTAWYLDTMAKPHTIDALSETTIYGLTPEQVIAATVEPNKTTVKKDRECQYCRRRMADRKLGRTMNEGAWVNVEYRTLDIALYGHEGSVPITYCPWCGREL